LGAPTTIHSVDTDAVGNVYLTGALSGVADFAGTLLAANGGLDVFVVKLSPAGAHLSSQKYGDAGSSTARDIALDAVGNVFVTGTFAGTIDFGSGLLTNLPGVNYSGFIARLP
jgi:hypothetical protein